MNILAYLVGALTLACAVPAAAQDATNVIAPAGYAPVMAPCVKQADRTCPAVAAANPLPTDIVVKAIAVDRGGSFGTTPAPLMPANPARRGWSIQVQAAATVNCYVNGTATATADYHSLMIPGGNYTENPFGHVGTGALSIICSAPATAVYAREW